MCIFPKPEQAAAPSLPTEVAAMRQPDSANVRATTGNRAADRLRASSNTILTSGSGVTATAPTEKKTLLGA